MTRLVLLSMCLLLVNCGPGYDRPTERTSTGCEVSSFGNGVFFFSCAYDFGPALAEFRKGHQVISITSYSSYNYGTTGYWVIDGAPK